MQENENQVITCNSSAGRPDPIVKWYLRNPRENNKYQLTQFSSSTIIPGDHDLNAVVSTLNFKPNRTINEWRLYCEVWTRTSEADITSKEITVNVSYPPENLPIIQGIDTNSILPVIESESGTFICSITGGNPPASLRWNCFGSTYMTYDIHENNRVTSTVNWKANRYQNKCSCISEHIDNWKRIINVTFNVQYPPAKPTIKIGHVIIVEEVRVIRYKSLRVICESKSNPSSNYFWTGPGTSDKVGYTLDIASVNILDQGEYKCQASNKMERMDNSYIVGSNGSSFNLTTLYFSGTPTFRFEGMKGQVIEANNLKVVRNDAFSIYCDVKGNPTPNVTWDTGHQGPNLDISSVYSDINRTCTATNVMRETASELEMRAMSTNSLLIEVFCMSLPLQLFLKNYTKKIN
ncbi:carcinoembryonic antigen-related cell adhesion molecule 5-like [Ruditapes philippinarum]|uniref:carcinoembryonic antigen-related cell adhesion molecule 5-like n=1 Tax=Ruditapes philippinarum TaxID=129788 RepID=UPI00295BD52D|nr:carcinoembryonic antigen-related cell adhesion molecule 5-like [Ruditapes philippinarum]